MFLNTQQTCTITSANVNTAKTAKTKRTKLPSQTIDAEKLVKRQKKKLAHEIFAGIRQQTTEATLTLWRNRHPQVKAATSKPYQKTMEIFLGLVDMTDTVRISMITAAAAILDWDPSTTNKY